MGDNLSPTGTAQTRWDGHAEILATACQGPRPPGWGRLRSGPIGLLSVEEGLPDGKHSFTVQAQSRTSGEATRTAHWAATTGWLRPPLGLLDTQPNREEAKSLESGEPG